MSEITWYSALMVIGFLVIGVVALVDEVYMVSLVCGLGGLASLFITYKSASNDRAK